MDRKGCVEAFRFNREDLGHDIERQVGKARGCRIKSGFDVQGHDMQTSMGRPLEPWVFPYQSWPKPHLLNSLAKVHRPTTKDGSGAQRVVSRVLLNRLGLAAAASITFRVRRDGFPCRS